MAPLPVILSIPHSGTGIPKEIRDAVALPAYEILHNTDAYTREIFAGKGHQVLATIKSDINRLFVDLNRPPYEAAGHYPHAVTYLDTTDGMAIYKPGQEPTPAMAQHLLNTYYTPYHQQIKNTLNRFPQAQLAIDCHSMRGTGSKVSNGGDPGAKRPAICLGDVFGQSCPPEMTDCLAQCLQVAFGLDPEEVVINHPFKGGFITQHYGQTGPIPWIQIEINRDLYMDEATLQPKPGVLSDFNRKFTQALQLFFQLQAAQSPQPRRELQPVA